MDTTACQSLYSFLRDHGHGDDPLHTLHAQLKRAQHAELSRQQIDRIIRLYQQALPAIERALWSRGPDEERVAQYQSIFRELERFIAIRGDDHRHDFIVVIPVADRPRHLRQCLQSLLTLCQRFQYGGFSDNRYSKVSVIVADDSKQPDSITRHELLCRHFTENGLCTEYFGQHEQKQLLERIDEHQRASLAGILGDCAQNIDTADYGHKGASIMRNIAYLRLNRLIDNNRRDNTLVYFIDSDQEFRIKTPTGSSAKDIYALNYFHHLDEIFTRTDADVLTGKVVGDPPVSPAVMSSRLLDDVIDFLRHLAALEPAQPCSFHTRIGHQTDDAAYHDMSVLFGFKHAASVCEYHCTLPPPHDHGECFEDFAYKLNRFFDGQHPTRITYFSYSGDLSATKPARTIYTGNYVFRPRMLDHFIAFATLKLRMAGPVLGRLLRADCGDRFVSANLPMLHNRTVEATGVSECRPGVNRDSDKVDLAEEFERQFYGDVMLFTVDRLTQAGYPALLPDETFIRQTLEATDAELRAQYLRKHEHTVKKLAELKQFYNNPEHWWHSNPGLNTANTEFIRFVNNLEHNFGDASYGYELINTTANRNRRHEEILRAILHYADDRIAWNEALVQTRTAL
jgi:hypothetical protein